METLIALAGILALIGGAVGWAYYKGRRSAAGDQAIETTRIQNEQLKAANQPRDRGSVIGRLRRGRF